AASIGRFLIFARTYSPPRQLQQPERRDLVSRAGPRCASAHGRERRLPPRKSSLGRDAPDKLHGARRPIAPRLIDSNFRRLAAPSDGDKLSDGACRPRSRLGGGRTRRPVPWRRPVALDESPPLSPRTQIDTPVTDVNARRDESETSLRLPKRP